MAEIPMNVIREATGRLLSGESTPEVEGTRYDLSDLIATLRETRARLQAIADTWTQAQLQTRPPEGATSPEGEDRWSATEALTHLIGTQNWYSMHLARLIGERKQFDLMPRGLGDLAVQDMPKDELAQRLRTATDDFLAELRAIPASADLTATRDSHFFGHLSVRGWVFLAINHDLMHLAQIERLLHFPGFPA